MNNIIICGVGGQGVILTSKVIMNTAMNAGYDVKESEVHGMAQRGGSVECNVRIGEKVHSPLIAEGSADFIVALELMEAMRKIKYLKDGGTLIVNRLQIDPVPVQNGVAEYPSDIEDWLKNNVKNCIIVDTEETLKEVKSRKALNIVMLGLLANYLEFSDDSYKESIKSIVKDKFVEMNMKAFDLGKKLSE